MTDQPSNDNVVAFETAASFTAKKRPAKALYCDHLRVTAVEQYRAIECRDCGCYIDPFEYLLSWAKREDRARLAVNGLRDQERELKQEIQSLATQRNDLARELGRLRGQKTRMQKGDAP